MYEFVEREDLQSIKLLQPQGWTDIIPYFEFYLNSPFCFPIKIIHNGVLAGVGNAIIHNKTGWLSHIIVHPEKRNLGIGTEATKALVELLRKKNCKTLLLLATELGEPVYKKLGFAPELKYLFFKDGTVRSKATNISGYSPAFASDILLMDLTVSGEDRQALLRPHLPNVKLVIEGGAVAGCYFPTVGEGLIIANNEEAGLALLNEKHKTQLKTAVPETNMAAIDFLRQQGFEQISKGTRMYLGEKINWQSEKLYSRIGGNLG